MPLYTVWCPGCGHTLEDILCTYVEAKSKQCEQCEEHVMEIVPAKCSVVWACDTSFSESKKVVKG
jgi:predicted nucleic acid-binding Zn ribbon protein